MFFGEKYKDVAMKFRLKSKQKQAIHELDDEDDGGKECGVEYCNYINLNF